MRRGREAEVAAKRRLVSMLKAEVEAVFVDVGWARGSVDAVVGRFGAAPVEVKLGARRDDLYRWQLYAEAYLLWRGLGVGVSRGYVYYAEFDELRPFKIGRDELWAGGRALGKAAGVVEGPLPPPVRSGKCGYCEFRRLC